MVFEEWKLRTFRRLSNGGVAEENSAADGAIRSTNEAIRRHDLQTCLCDFNTRHRPWAMLEGATP
ncbi:hypothetical protein [Arthrobacter sp. AFG7.2]|uniref:hypothetical protein n=1 Tax=Arthrobacter sp. AFG7.2 TaxID=1688693 RepID=UPI0011AEFBD5|nr:hypothetical protein [Arthrobacter sp. AFG7.2]